MSCTARISVRFLTEIEVKAVDDAKLWPQQH